MAHRDAELIEHLFATVTTVELVGRWWNGMWGRLARRDVWLETDGRQWRVRAREGGDDGRELTYLYTREPDAREMVARLMKTSSGTWRDLTEAVRQSRRRHSS